ncbi:MULTISPECIES: wax ester/triacylglycerol synthase domain-containing protein [Mycobacterium]|uniref:diacylglycerol O-acyltransferase n=2 Tax=Mycobacterium TaxID=1763 RepID=A0AA37UZ07_9MYCO|nr:MULTISPECIES: wax ester/triacylglycerol synthase domain-containing protein [Mycobacterium]GLB82908.1 diacylglycerol O-acyltransferase [Mycobacterium kiyosense]GLB96198.1 diacylglycerol O-acyltransferase [Mycobacterium kiyosense]GLD40546.1 diacylglycerol O-acyltransferase [Mycobacterium kiyosense]
MPNTDADTLASWGGGQDLSAWEALMWRTAGDHRTRSTGVMIELLDTEPDWDRLVAAHDRFTLRVPRLRERIVEPVVSVVAPAWSPDPHFDLAYHLQRVRLPGDGSMAELHALAAQFAARPLDPERPPWEALLVLGVAGGQAAYLFKPHHSLSDGIGLLQLLDLAHGHSRKPGPADDVPMPEPRRKETPEGLLVNRLAGKTVSAPGSVLREALRVAGRFAGDPIGTTTEAAKFAMSLRRVLAPLDTPHSPALTGGGSGYRLDTFDVPFDELKAAGRAAGGSVNDAFLAALLGGVRRYHEKLSLTVDSIPIAIPVSLRTDADPLGANKFAGARFVAPVGEPDPKTRIAAVHDLTAEARLEPALGFLDLIAPVLSRLPGVVLTRIAGEMTGLSDFQASNLGAIGRPLYLAGARVTRVYPMGPRPGIPAMMAMITYEGTCCIAVNFDPEAITDAAAFSTCLREGFEEVTALAHTG